MRKPVWVTYAQKFGPIKLLNGEMSDVTAAFNDKKDAVESSKTWLKNSRVFQVQDRECKAPTGAKIAGFAGNYVGGEAGAAAGAAMGSVVPGIGTIIGGIVGGLVGSEIGEKAASGDVDAEVEQCEIVFKYAQDSYQQLPSLQEQEASLQSELKTKTEELEPELEQVKEMTSEINPASAF